MRKLVYEGFKNDVKVMETSSWGEMQEGKMQGLKFRSRLDEVREERPISEKTQGIINRAKAKIIERGMKKYAAALNK